MYVNFARPHSRSFERIVLAIIDFEATSTAVDAECQCCVTHKRYNDFSSAVAAAKFKDGKAEGAYERGARPGSLCPLRPPAAWSRPPPPLARPGLPHRPVAGGLRPTALLKRRHQAPAEPTGGEL
eukprot:scaffold257610_cov48-Prasinocladus_malaysianus.AAC.1